MAVASTEFEKQKAFIVKLAYWLIVFAIVFFVLNYAMPVFTPFIIGAVVSLILLPLTEWVTAKTGLKRKIVAVVLVALFYLIMGGLFFLLGSLLVTFIGDMMLALPEYYSNVLEPAILNFFYVLNQFVVDFAPVLDLSLVGFAENAATALTNMVL